MEAIHARYPFLTAARKAVETADVDLEAIASEATHPIIDRAVDRVTHAIDTGTIGSAHRSHRVELLSYPIARVIVSLADEPGLTERYASAEAETAKQRYITDLDATPRLRSVDRTNITLTDLLAEFDLSPVLTESAHGYRIDVMTYLSLASALESDQWRLVSRPLTNGTVPITRSELYDLLSEAIRTRVLDGLPLAVPEEIAIELSDITETIRRRLADISLSTEFETVAPELFPPCIQALLDRLETPDPLPAHSQFALTAFLAATGMASDDIVDTLTVHPGIDDAIVRRHLSRLRDDTTPAIYPPPSCQTMQAYGDCTNMDALCDQIMHPLTYYERRLNNDDTVLTAEP